MAVKRGLSPVQRTLRQCRDQGRFVDKAEKFNAYAGPFGRREDLFGFVDIVAIDTDAIVGIQATGQSGHAEHKRKILETEYALAWLQAGGRIELWSWRKVKMKRGGKAMRWQPRIERITKDMFDV